MIAKFPGKCNTCGNRFPAGVEVTWSKQNGVTACPKCNGRGAHPPTHQPVRPPAHRPPRKPSPPPVAGEKSIRRPSHGRDDNYDLGIVMHLIHVSGGGGPDGKWWVPFETGKTQDENDEWECWARVRPATDDEVAPTLSVVERKRIRDNLLKELEHLVRTTTSHSWDAPTPYPKGGEIVLRQALAGGSRYIVTPTVVWLVESSYDDGPHYWHSKDPRALEIAETLLKQD